MVALLLLEKKDIKQAQNNNNIIIDNSKEGNTQLFKSKFITIFDFNIKDINSQYTLFELKKYINKKFNIREFEYDLLINENQINNLPDNTQILYLFKKYNTNKIIIKSFKNIFDIYKSLNDYENHLMKNISLKENEIELLKKEYENLKNDLENI
jgi:hypothetical protein